MQLHMWVYFYCEKIKQIANGLDVSKTVRTFRLGNFGAREQKTQVNQN